ncbi:MAG: hypothetical protein FD175_1636 [Beijerinckiaceae bacterium]|nr:MAG: hypothetical protein FD175_1636 [Beijerinckiaceae bacterium]
MVNLFEIMQAAQGGNAYNTLAQQFGIGTEQAQKAVEAVLPAMSMGLQQQAETMEGWQKILSSLSQGQNSAQFFDSDGDGIPDNLEDQGQNALGAMFGAPQISEAVATQAAQFAGLPATMMQQMLPMIATMVLGGLFKGAMNNGLGGILGQMMQGGQTGGMGNLGNIFGGMLGQGMAPQAQSPAGGMFGNILGQMMGGQQAQPQPQAGGLGGMFGNILGQMMGGGRPQPAPPPPAPDPVASGLDMLKGMFETGKEVQSTQMDALQQIFGQFTQRK